MAIAKASVGIDIFTVDLNWYVQNLYDVGFQNNVYINYDGHTYQDVYAVTGYDGFDYLAIAFGGNNITINSNYDVLGGTVTGVVELDAYTLTPLWSVAGISLSATQLYQSGLTSSNSDELNLIRQALSGNDTFYLSGDADKMSGFAGNDVLHAGGGNDTVFGDTGNDTLFGQGGFDRLLGGSGSDMIIGGSGRDFLAGQGSSDNLSGGGGADTLRGGGYGDVLSGGTGGDRLFGDKGADTLSGDAGRDKLTGGDGPDRFVFANGFGHDTITDFSANDHEDIDLSHVTAITSFSDLVQHHLSTDLPTGDALIVVDGHNSVLLHGITVAQIGAGLAYSGHDFIF